MRTATDHVSTRVGFGALMERETLRILKIWSQTLAFPTITAMLYIAVFGAALGNRIGTISGVSYLSFVLPGIILMQAATQAYNNNASTTFQARSDRYIDDILSAPMHAWQVSVALLWGGVLRGTAVSVLVLICSALFIDVHVVHPIQAVVLLLAVTILWGSIGVITGIWAESWDQHMLIGNVLIMPLVFVGGVFYSIDMLPHQLAWLTRIDPLFYQVQGLRHAFLGTSDSSFLLASSLTISLAVIALAIQVALVRSGWRLKE